MGAYIYRVTAKLVKLADGRVAHVAKYAYKPYWSDRDGLNAKMHFKSGCVASENLTLRSDLIATINDDDEGDVGNVYENKLSQRVFYDDSNFGYADRMPHVAAIRKEGKAFRIFPGVSHTPFDKDEVVRVCQTASEPLSHPAMTVRTSEACEPGKTIYAGRRIDTGEEVSFWASSVIGYGAEAVAA